MWQQLKLLSTWFKAPQKTHTRTQQQQPPNKQTKSEKHIGKIIWYLDTDIFSQIAPLTNGNHKSFLPEQGCSHAHVVVLNQHYL